VRRVTRTAAQIRALFVRERARFARTFPAVAAAALAIDWSPRLGRARRAYAYATHDGTIVLSQRARALPLAQLRGLLRHELGHLADRDWSRPGAEQRADDLAERATGQRIRYARDTLVQTTGPGIWPRPRRLHR
jgi:hypothetical protein